MGDDVKMEDKKDQETKEETKEEEKQDEDVPMKEEEEEETEPPKAELTEEETKLIYARKQEVTDLLVNVLNSSYSQFSMPEKSEGFNEIRYVWNNEAKSKEHFR